MDVIFLYILFIFLFKKVIRDDNLFIGWWIKYKDIFFFGFYWLRGDNNCDFLKFLCFLMSFIFWLILILLLEIKINILYVFKFLILDINWFLVISLINKKNEDNRW